MAKEVPVYLFTGFLESGKTKFIQETLEDERFNTGEKTLLLVCEEGEEEYNPDTYSGKNVYTEVIDSEDDLNDFNLRRMLHDHRAERVVIEYNGMWLLQDLYDAMPDGWLIYQQINFVDSTTFEIYNSNMRNLMYDKLKDCELVVFNRSKVTDDQQLRHKIVRAANRTCDIAYEYEGGEIKYDDIVDPPPYDMNAPIVTIGDKDYAWFYSDIANDMKPFIGKKINFLGYVVINKKLPADTFLIGRDMMNCCAADISFSGFAAQSIGWNIQPKNRQWYRFTARIDLEFNPAYSNKGPVMKVMSAEPEMKPEDDVATFM